MVFEYQTPCGHLVYKGKDKYENEELIKYSFPIDVWFHAADLSSAHVYLRLEQGESWDQLEEQLLQYVLQLTKENSIEGSKKAQIDIVYTPARNLKKSPEMEVGAVNYKDEKLVRKVKHVTKDRMILKTIEKTEEWVERDLAKALEDYEAKIAKDKFLKNKEEDKKKKQAEEERRLEKERLDYKLMDKAEFKSSNKDFNEEEDFM